MRQTASPMFMMIFCLLGCGDEATRQADRPAFSAKELAVMKGAAAVQMIEGGARQDGMRLLHESLDDWNAASGNRPAPNPDYVELAGSLRETCETEEAYSCMLLALMYHEGLGVDQNDELADELSIAACAHGLELACGNAEAATDYARALCDSGSPAGCAALGLSHAMGWGVKKNEPAAVQLFGKACEGGIAHGCRELGRMYSLGRGIRNDQRKAGELFRQACETGDPTGCFYLALMYREGKGVPKDEPAATRFLQMACDGGDAGGCFSVGQGHLKSGNYENAIEVFQVSCAKEFRNSCAALGYLYYGGLGAAKNEAESVRYFRMACGYGDGESCAELRRIRP